VRDNLRLKLIRLAHLDVSVRQIMEGNEHAFSAVVPISEDARQQRGGATQAG